jgi:hypothetical protein
MKNILMYVFISIGIFFAGAFSGYIFEWNYEKKEITYYYDGIWPMLMPTHIDKGYMPDEGFVPDVKTAIKIAKAVWVPIYGEKNLLWRRYAIRLVDDSVWVIEGGNTLGMNGGGPFIRIDKWKGTILEVTHTF